MFEHMFGYELGYFFSHSKSNMTDIIETTIEILVDVSFHGKNQSSHKLSELFSHILTPSF